MCWAFLPLHPLSASHPLSLLPLVSASQGWLSFQLDTITTPIGLGGAVFQISTWDYGKPERVYDTVTHRLVNPVDLEYWYAGAGQSAAGSAAVGS